MSFFQKIVELEKSAIDKISKNSTYLKILALIVALVFFVIVNGTGFIHIDKFFQTTEYVENIKLNYMLEDDRIVYGLPETIDVNVSGSESQVKNVEKNSGNITAEVNLENKDDGTYQVYPDDIQFSNNYGARLVPTQSFYNITLDTLVEVTEPVEVGYANQNLNNKLLLDDPVLETPQVTFEVGKSQVGDISSVRVLLDLSKLDPDDTEEVYNVPIEVYDSNGHVVDTHTTLPKIKVDQTYSEDTDSIPIIYDVVNNDTGEYISSLDNKSIQNQTVDVYGSKSKIDKLEAVTYTIDMSDYSEKNQAVKVTPELPSGVYSSDANQYNANVTLEEGVTKTITKVPVDIENIQDGIKLETRDLPDIDISITGAPEVIDKFNNKNIHAYVDIGDVKDKGEHTLDIQTNLGTITDNKLNQTTETINVI